MQCITSSFVKPKDNKKRKSSILDGDCDGDGDGEDGIASGNSSSTDDFQGKSKNSRKRILNIQSELDESMLKWRKKYVENLVYNELFNESIHELKRRKINQPSITSSFTTAMEPKTNHKSTKLQRVKKSVSMGSLESSVPMMPISSLSSPSSLPKKKKKKTNDFIENMTNVALRCK